MKIELINAEKRFNRDRIFKQLDLTVLPKEKIAITGPNGSGKSTLLQVIAGSIALNSGEIKWSLDDQVISAENIYQHISIAAPYLELIEEYTAKEFLQFHSGFKPLLQNISIQQALDIVGLDTATNKQIRLYSSGMKQRLKLAQAFFSDTPLLLLDEPCTNLDASGYELYDQLIAHYSNNRTVIISSNDINEYKYCERKIAITDFK